MSSAPTAFPSPCSPSVSPTHRAPVWPSLGVARGLRPPRGGVAPSPIPSMSSIVPFPQGQWPSCVARSLSLAASTPSPASPASSLPCPSPCASGGAGSVVSTFVGGRSARLPPPPTFVGGWFAQLPPFVPPPGVPVCTLRRLAPGSRPAWVGGGVYLRVPRPPLSCVPCRRRASASAVRLGVEPAARRLLPPRSPLLLVVVEPVSASHPRRRVLVGLALLA